MSEKAVALNTIKPDHDGKTAQVGGAIVDVREITTKNGQKMAFVKIADQFSEVELVLFPGIYQQTTGIWERDRIVLAKGKITAKDRAGNTSQEIKILVDDAREVTHEQASGYQPTGKKPRELKTTKKSSIKAIKNETKTLPTRVYVRLTSSSDQERLLSLKQTIDAHPGETEVVLVIGDDAKQIIRLPNRIAHETGLSQLQTVIGVEHVKLQ